MDDGDGSAAASLALIVVLAAGAVSIAHAAFVLSSAEFDEASPVPGYQRWIGVAGIVAGVGFLALLHHMEGITNVNGAITVTVVLLAASCALTIWHQRSTVDVTPTGFHRAAYEGYWFDLYVNNTTDAPIVVSIGTDTRFPARLRAPGRTIGPHDRVALKWPTGVYGAFTLAITSPLAPGARGSVPVTREELPENHTI